MNVRDPRFFDLSRFTNEELLAMAERARPAREAADREAAPLFARQMLEAELNAESVIYLEAGDELALEVDDPAFFDLSRFTAEELHEADERMRPALEEANRQDAGLRAAQMAESELDGEGDCLIVFIVRAPR